MQLMYPNIFKMAVRVQPFDKPNVCFPDVILYLKNPA